MPVAPIAGFSPFQQQAFNQIQGMQGMSLPYFNQASQYLQNSAAPISASDVQNYYNPFAQNVFANMQDVFGQQMKQTTGNLQQQAGGIGADRIAVAQANLAKQQGLAAGQTAASLYQPALQAAQQQKQMEAGAGYGLGQLGPSAQQSYLLGTGALAQAGAQQQGLTQAQLNAQYQNQLAQIAYPFQTPQYLAGITGGLAPAFGGTSYGQATTTYPTPSALAQGLGIGTSLAGLAGSQGMFGGGLGGLKGSGAGSIFGGGATDAEALAAGLLLSRGGRTDHRNPFASGGSTYGNLASDAFSHSKVGNPYADDSDDQGYADGGDVDDTSIPSVPGASIPKAGSATPIPRISLPMGAGHSGLMTGMLDLHPQPKTPPGQQQSGGIGGDISKLISAIPKDARGGPVNPFDTGMGFQEGGGSPDDEPIDASDIVLEHQGLGQKPNWSRAQENAPAMVAEGATPLAFNDEAVSPVAEKASEIIPAPRASRAVPANPYLANRDMRLEDYTANPNRPYPDATQRDWGQQLTRSPWMSLVHAGAAMANSVGPIGSVIGRGIAAGAGELEGQRKALLSEEDRNQKADSLFARAKMHLDEYQRMTPEGQARLTESKRAHREAEADRHERLVQQERLRTLQNSIPRRLGTGASGNEVFGIPDLKNPGQWIIVDPETGKPIDKSANVRQDEPAPAVTPTNVVADVSGTIIPKNLAGPDLPRDEAFLDSLPENRKAIVKGLADYQINPNSLSVKGGHREMLMNDALRYDKNFDQRLYNASQRSITEFNVGGPMSPAGTLTAGNTAILHAKEMSDAIEKLGQQGGVLSGIGRMDIPFVSYAANQLRNASVRGTSSGVPLTEFETARQRFTEEVTKFYAGSQGSEHERDRAIKLLDSAKSLPELRSAIQQDAQLMKDKVEQLASRLRSGMQPAAWRKALTQNPEALLTYRNSEEALKAIKERHESSTQKIETPQTQIKRPTSVPAGSAYSQKLRMWRTPDGNLFDATGQRIQ